MEHISHFSTSMSAALQSNLSILSSAEQAIAQLLLDAGQEHLFEHWPAPGEHDEDKRRLLAQAIKLDALYPGGIVQYVANARDLLEKSRLGVNPYEGYTPEVPLGERLVTGSDDFLAKERVGLNAIGGVCFVLVAGGLGERLGYNGIKVELPSELTTGACFLSLYCQHILALQQRARQVAGADQALQLPLAIMTSGDTHDRTVRLLQDNHNFGMADGQITLIKQELVPALKDSQGRFALQAADPFEIQVKPHGHGDVHTLLHQHGLVQKWASEGRSWVLFFQDTNGLIFHALPAFLGVSVSQQFAVNSLTVARKPGEAVGGICALRRDNGDCLTINVEYNQLDPLLRATVSPAGDVPDASGFSPYPGNINVLLFSLDTYAKTLQRTAGAVPEFINPKYQDKEKTVFTPTRLECMMQDFPKLLGAHDRVGFTQMDRWLCFSAVKNNVVDARKKAKDTGFGECASSGEADMYAVHRLKLELCGVRIDQPSETKSFAGIPLSDGAHVVLSPSFACSLVELKEKLGGASSIHLSARSTLIVDGRDVHFNRVDVDGALVVRAGEASEVRLDQVSVHNDGWQFAEIDTSDSQIAEKYRIRGYVLQQSGQCVLEYTQPGVFTVNQ